MARPGSVVIVKSTPTQLPVDSDSGAAFLVGLSDMGPLSPQLVYSLNDFTTIYGLRQTYSFLYDWLDTYFHEGGSKCYVSRVVGPGATTGFKNLVDNVAAVSLIATAIGPGAWSANYKVAVVNPGTGGAGTYKIQVTDAANNVLEDSGDLTSQQGAVDWSKFSKYIRITLGASALLPVNAAAAALSAGNDDRNNITDAQWQAAIDLFTKDLGEGQIAAPARNTAAGWNQLLTHAQNNNRRAIIDPANTATEATLEGYAASIRSRYGAMFAPWIVIPPVVGVSNRTLPSSALICGMIARNDPSLGPDRPAAGNAGGANYVIDISQPDWTDTQRTNLNAAGVNVVRRFRGGIRNYGWRTLTDPSTDPTWLDFGNSRLVMDIADELGQIAENFVFEDIDGLNGQLMNQWKSALTGPLLRRFQQRQFFGDDPSQAFLVDIGSNVNSLLTIAALELHAVVSVKPATMAEYVEIDVVKRAVTEVL